MASNQSIVPDLDDCCSSQECEDTTLPSKRLRLTHPVLINPRIKTCRNCDRNNCYGNTPQGSNGMFCTNLCRFNCEFPDCHAGKIIPCLSLQTIFKEPELSANVFSPPSEPETPDTFYWRPCFLNHALQQEDAGIKPIARNGFRCISDFRKTKIIRTCRNCKMTNCRGSTAWGRRGLNCLSDCIFGCGTLNCHGGYKIKCLCNMVGEVAGVKDEEIASDVSDDW